MFLTFLKSKIGKVSMIVLLLIIMLSAFVITIKVKDNAIRKKENELYKQREKIENLELSKEVLEKELDFYKENENYHNSFSNSSAVIEEIEKDILTRYDNEAINFISNDFYNYFNKLHDYKVYKNSAVNSSSKILYTSYYKQERFNKSLSRERYQNRRMAAMV